MNASSVITIPNMVAEQRGCSTAVIEMAEFLQRIGEQPSELSVEDRNLRSVAYGSTVAVVQHGASSPALSRRRNSRIWNSRLRTRGSTSRKWKMKSRGSVMAFLHSSFQSG